MMSLFEDFSSPEADTAEPVSPEAMPGFAEGFAAGEAAAIARQNTISSEFVAQLDDMAFGFAEAQQALISALVPFFTELVETLLPETCEARFQAELVTAMTQAATHDLGQPITVHVNPTQLEGAKSLIAEQALAGFAIRPDPALSEHAALISVGGQETALDVDGQTAALIKTLGNLTSPALKERQNG